MISQGWIMVAGEPNLQDKDLDFLLGNLTAQQKGINSLITPPMEVVSEIKLTMRALVLIYQKTISSLDKPSCIFTLSCSRFGDLAMSRYGILFGLLMTSDRIQRCHPLGQKYYPIDIKRRLAIDFPLERYFLGTKTSRQYIENLTVFINLDE